mgnify:CR=1 FL=1
MRRPGSNECLQDKPRNRHFAEWRFLPLIRTVTVNPKIWNVIVIGMSLTSLPEDTVTNRLPYSFGALGGHKTIFILPKTAHFVNSRRTTSPPRSARHLPLSRGGFSARTQGSPCQGEAFPPAPKAPLVKGSWRAAPERLPPPQRAKAPLSGELSAQQTERLPQICHNLSVTLRVPPPLQGEAFLCPCPLFLPLANPLLP